MDYQHFNVLSQIIFSPLHVEYIYYHESAQFVEDSSSLLPADLLSDPLMYFTRAAAISAMNKLGSSS